MKIIVPGWDGVSSDFLPSEKQMKLKFEFLPDTAKECDLLIVFDEKQRGANVKCPDNCVWLLAYEPPVDCYAHFKDGYKHYDLIQSEWQDIPAEIKGKIIHELYPQFWGVNKTFTELDAISINDCDQKLDQVSAIISSANNLPGHKMRRKFIEFLKEKNFDLVHFGSGYNYIPDKFDGIFPYKYSIAMENSSFPNYCTEKISDCYLSLTMPIYWGCPNITKYFPKESMLLLDETDFEGSLEMIKEAVANDLWSKNIEAIIHARDLVLHKYSFYPYLCNLVEKYYNPLSEPKSKIIPAILSPKERKFSYKIKKKLGIYKLKNYLKKRKLQNSGK